ncbi:major facilitator superfamily transporter [Lichtheimia corymbifera JMRC:FSU:9682]|uniref:Lysosomal dipeptide transporter MFSD1 n=1 Tax=Lichtheimia corymbifera JMRC:FSU:9682 TaxID=1263082 RepID=A0A068RNW4_9FUNG|nr:major facilitator superfamily transporter [Lichtheimia corymbifera JMRC:FSU:9682]
MGYEEPKSPLDRVTTTTSITAADDVKSSNDVAPGDTALANAAFRYKMIALITALMLPVGSHFSGTALGAMKSELKNHLGIDNTRYGVVSASVSIVNTIFPVAGGIFIDRFGSVWGTLGVSLCIITGSLLTALAGRLTSFPLMVAGRVIFGIGSGLIVTMQESLLSKWFRTQSLSIAIGIQLSVSQLASFLGTLAANPLAERTGNWVWPFWLSLILCGFSMIMNIVYALMVRHLSGGGGSSSKTTTTTRRKKFQFRSILKFPWLFWLIITIEFLYAAVWSSFQTISTELVQVHFGTTSVIAGYKASASVVVPIVATPVLGLIMDLFGFRICILLLSSVFLILSSALLGWTYVDAVVGMVFYSISLAFGPIAMITSIGMVLPSDYIGTGLGLYKSSNNSKPNHFYNVPIHIIDNHC